MYYMSSNSEEAQQPALFVPQIANYPTQDAIIAAEKVRDYFIHESLTLVANKIARYIDSIMNVPADKIDWNVKLREFTPFYVKIRRNNAQNPTQINQPVNLTVTLQKDAVPVVVCKIDCKLQFYGWTPDEAQYDHDCRVLLKLIGKIFAPLATVDVDSERKCTIHFPLFGEVLDSKQG